MNPGTNPPTRERKPLTPEERDAARASRARWGLLRSILMLIGLIVLAVVLARRPAEVEVLSITPAKALDDTYRAVEPTGVFAPTDTFFVSAEISGYRPGMNFIARWRHEGQYITETPLQADGVGAGYAGFALSPQEPPTWPEGRYTVDVLHGEQLLGQAAFEVVGE